VTAVADSEREFLTHEGSGRVRLGGRWIIDNVSALSATLERLRTTGDRALSIDASGVEDLDLTGAVLLGAALRELTERGVRIEWLREPPPQLAFVRDCLAGSKPAIQAPEESFDFAEPVRTIGRWVVERAGEARETLAFFGRFCVVFGRSLLSFRHLRLPSLVRHVFETGVQAIPIVSLIAFLISVIIAYMGATELRKFGAEIFVVDLVTIGVLREMAVLLTAIIVAGRSGSAFAAEIGVMKLNEEVDALDAIGVEPTEVLVLPRVLGLMIAMPLLTIVADAVGLAGGGLLCYWLLDIPLAQYLARVQEAIAPTTFWVGIIKAPVFAFLIAFVATLRGMQVRGSSRELGRLTTVAVVQSIFLVILADALFAVLFLEYDI
jgi:phospholipid/cholesterol/gamma-HCH transport system permease protein